MVRSAARRIWMWSPARKQAIANARVPGMKPYHVKCASCGIKMRESVSPKPFAVDHKIPASEPAAQIKSWDDFFERLFDCPPSNLQILCLECHDTKTREENAARKVVKSRSLKRAARRHR